MVKVFDPSIGKRSKLFLQLVQDGDEADLILVDEDGDKVGAGNVATISQHGIRFHSGVDRRAPFKLNDCDEIFNRDKDC